MNMKLCEATRDMLRPCTLLGFIKLHVLFKAVQGRSKDAELVRTAWYTAQTPAPMTL